jgi:hypothetical protein
MRNPRPSFARYPHMNSLALCMAAALALTAPVPTGAADATPSALGTDALSVRAPVALPLAGRSPFEPWLPAAPWSALARIAGNKPSPTGQFVGSRCVAGSAIDMTDLTCSRISLKTGALAIENNGRGTGKPPGLASTFIVSSCTDSSASGAPGELRYEVAKAADGDTVDMSGLTCGAITLYYGAITVNQNELYLTGPGADKLVITGAYAYHAYEQDRIINHLGTGTLVIRDLAVSYGAPYSTNSLSSVSGGCIASSGSVYLGNVQVSNCTARTNGVEAEGGGVYAVSNLALVHSIVENSRALASGAASFAEGGGVMAGAYMLCDHCSIESNQANGTSSAVGGGASARGSALFESATISGNQTNDFGGGIAAGGTSVELFNSTVSGNSAARAVGGVYSSTNTTVYYSTIAFNTVASTTSQPGYAPGLAVRAGAAITVTLNNSLLSNNTYAAGTENDFSTLTSGSGSVTVAGGGNLIRTTFSGVPIGTVTGACPDLGPLRDNGGPTKTHALQSRSPAIDRGEFMTLMRPLFDQRGQGYLRVSGPALDIGAYEVQQNDILFNNGFDGCP